MGLFLSIGVFDIVLDLIRGERGPKDVTFNNELFGDFSEVRYHARDVTLGVKVFCGGA